MAPAVALKTLRHCLSEGKIIPTQHFRVELRNEEMILPDAWHVLRGGKIHTPAELDIKTGEWKYRIEGDAPCGTPLCIVFCFRQTDVALLITVFSVTSGRGLTNRRIR